MRAVERAGEPRRELSRPRRHGDQHAGRGRPVQERHQEVDRGRVGPVQVVQRQHERLGGGELLEQLDHRAVDAVALVQGRPLRRPGFRQRRQDLAELRAHRRVEPFEPSRVEALDVPVEGVDEDPEREVLLELGRRAFEHEMTARVGPRGELGEQAALADPRRSDHLDRARRPALERRERLVERGELLYASYERHPGHSSLGWIKVP